MRNSSPLQLEKQFRSDPLVSIVIPSYNHSVYLRDRLESIARQTFNDYEVICLDDGSVDRSQNLLIREFAQTNLISQLALTKVNSGSPFIQWKKGISMAQGRYIWLAESDDIAAPTFLERAVAELEKGSDLFFCRCQAIDSSGKAVDSIINWVDAVDKNKFRTDFRMAGPDFAKKYLSKRNVITNASSVVIRREKISFPACLDSYRACGDWVAWTHLASKCCEIISYSASELCYHRTHNRSTRSPHTINKKYSYALEIVRASRDIMKILNINLVSSIFLATSLDHSWISDQLWSLLRLYGCATTLRELKSKWAHLYLLAYIQRKVIAITRAQAPCSY